MLRGSESSETAHVADDRIREIDNTEITDTVHQRRAPMMPASAGLLTGR
jgi:hypothetical protein